MPRRDFEEQAQHFALERNLQSLDSLQRELMIFYHDIKRGILDDPIYNPLLKDLDQAIDKLGGIIRDKINGF